MLADAAVKGELLALAGHAVMLVEPLRITSPLKRAFSSGAWLGVWIGRSLTPLPSPPIT